MTLFKRKKPARCFVIIILVTCTFAYVLMHIVPELTLTASHGIPELDTNHFNAALWDKKVNPPDLILIHPLIIGNPMHSAECRNAIIDRDDINIHQLLTDHLPIIYNRSMDDGSHSVNKSIEFLQNREYPQFWGREQITALLHDIEWWSGARVHVSYDPFWYFEFQHIDGYGDKQRNYQHHELERKRNHRDKERMAVLEEYSFFKDSASNLPPPRYDITKPLVDEIASNQSLEARSKVNEVVYYHIPKCGSSSMKAMLNQIGGTRIIWRQSFFKGYVSPQILNRNIQCGFTFVRHPIHRFISGYYTLNWMLEGDFESMKAHRVQSITKELNYWDIADECFYNFSCFERVHVFVDQLVDDGWKWINNYNNVYSQRVMEHVGSISGHFMASYSHWKIDYIGKVEHFEQHWSALSREITECKTGYLERYWEEMEGEMLDGMVSSKEKKASHQMYGTGQRDKRTLNRPLVDAYYALAIDQKLYEKLAEYYFQDFVCFDYDASYESFVRYVRARDPTFHPQQLHPSKIH